jgi:hypothetical protein
MKLQIDTKEKIIQVEDSITMSHLIRALKFYEKEWTIQTPEWEVKGVYLYPYLLNEIIINEDKIEL